MTFVLQTLDDPNATHGTVPLGVDKNGNIVGYYLDASNDQQGFIYLSGNFFGVLSPFENSTLVLHGISGGSETLAGTLNLGGESFAFFEAIIERGYCHNHPSSWGAKYECQRYRQ